ncbi:MAG TPA: VWA domain-containing protein [Candidatus Polarisedimenticolaceae bacterium]
MSSAGPALLAVLAAAAAPPALQPERPVVERVEVRRILVTVRLDAKGSAPPDSCDRLSAEDLEATIAGKPVKVVAADRVPRPRMYWLILDTSGSTADRGQRKLAKEEAARYAREVLVPGRDRAAVLTIDEDLRLVEPSSDDPEAIARAIEAIPPGAQSLITDALDEVLAQIAGDRREHVVVFWTDGKDGLSLRAMPALRRRLAAAPNARIFPVVVQGDAGTGSRLPPQLLFELAEATGGRVSLSADRRWLEVLRSAVKHRWRVAVEAPEGTPEQARPKLRSRNASCDPAIVPDADPPGDRYEGRAPPEWEREHRRQRRRDDDASCPAGDGAFGTEGGVAGCALDVVREQGILYAHAAPYEVETLSPARFALRRYFVPAFDPADLASEPWTLLETLERYPLAETVDDDGVPPTSRHPLLVHARTFFTIQGTIARALRESQPGWHETARRRLAAEAEADVPVLAEDLQAQAPSLSAEDALAAAEASPFGRAARAAIDSPSDADLRRTIGAWLGDISARDLFVGWERAMIDRRLRGESVAGAFESRWSALRRWFALPEHARAIVPLVPMRDPARDVVGFWRVFLPRAYWIYERREGSRGGDPIPYDHVPPQPLGWWLLESLPVARPDLAAQLSAGSWSVAELDYAPAGRLWKEDPAHPYSSADVLLVLASGADRLTLRARIDEGARGRALVTLDAE